MTVKRARPGPRAEERRERLISAGYRAMVRSGLEGARTRDIAAEAGITVATLHYYFPTKNDLVRAVLEHTIREQMLAPLRLDADWDDGPAALRTMLTGLSRQAEAEPGRFRLLNEMTWAAREDAELRAMLATWHGAWHETIVEWLRAGQRDGRVRGDIDTDAAATMIVYLVLGMVMRPPLPAGVEEHVSDELHRLLAAFEPKE
ncbi:TetR family transcriptional regulator [Nonomuraea polychroma]|uniref:TetR family transcriptional regulator n=1 Tax=Nonomuraea polychroma TaxID=46176 RepID=A0A438MQ21_9ACTN|nr:TetR family transcriptional regulator [Nonomuraea polychroma]RVX48014.1 TetR family transcriptional regulator [Nonomuraea polychroma]